MDLYAENVLDHYRHPRHTGKLSNPTVSHREENLSCGDDLRVELRVENGTIAEIAWQGTGCAISQAAMSLLSEELVGKNLEEVGNMRPESVRKLLGVPIGTRREKCAFLGLHTLKNVLQKIKGEEALPWRKTVQIDKVGQEHENP